MNEAMGLTAADVAAVTRNDGYDNGFGNGGWWIWIILIAFLFCGNGWGRNNDTATTAGENAFLSDEFVKRDIFNTNQNVSNTACQTQRDVLESRYTTQLGLQQMQAQQLCIAAVGHHTAGRQAAIVQRQFHPKLRLHHIGLCGDLLQQLAQVQRIEPRVLLGAQKIQQRHHFVHSAVQPCRRSADIVHRLSGLLVGTHMRKVLVQIFAIASDQAQCMEACLFHILLRDRLRSQCTRLVLPHLLHTLVPPVFYAQSSF